MQGDKLYQFLMPYQIYHKLQRISKTKRESVAAIIRHAIEAFLKNPKCTCEDAKNASDSQ